MPTTELNLIVLRSTDIERSAAFYAGLGLTFTKHRHGSGPEHCSCKMSSLVFEIYPLAAGGEGSTGARLGFRVESVDAAFAALTEAGGRVISEPKDSEWGSGR